MKQIVCVKWGTGYGPEYVNRLYGMVSRHITGPFRVVCLTDDRAGIRAEVECFDLPELGVPHPERTAGKWRKQVLWGETVPGLEGVALFIDLDSVIVGSLDPYFEFGNEDDVICARNWARPLARLGQTSVFRFKVGANAHLLKNFRADPQGVADKYGFEQHYVTASVTGGIKFWPESWTRHFRLHCMPAFPLNYFVTAHCPKDALIVTFPGGPNPDDVLMGCWNKNVPPYRTRLQHLMALFSGPRVDEKRWRHLRRYVLPVPWIAEAWKD
ncbi:glycosyl transferase [Roseateles sp. BYS96W]|uniref:Glycosyl transferase n=1 Tax=Pelomonas nitida TaxID=3299027 RepID=A0ABW7G7U2_9BURK